LHKANFIYLHILAWPDETLMLPPLPQTIQGSQVLTAGRVDVSQSEHGVAIKVAQADRHPIDTIVKLEVGAV
jgi:alpha-L-fucosidase